MFGGRIWIDQLPRLNVKLLGSDLFFCGRLEYLG
jgi:hypothetical protein